MAQTVVVDIASLAPHFLLFCWVNGLSHEHATRAVGLLCAMMLDAPDDVEKFVSDHLRYVQDDSEYPGLFLARVSRLLRHPDMLSPQGEQLLLVCSRVVGYKADIFAQVVPPKGVPELIPCLMVYCHWFHCNVSAENGHDVIIATMETIRCIHSFESSFIHRLIFILTARRIMLQNAAERVGGQLLRYWGPLNFVPIYARYLIKSVIENVSMDFSTWFWISVTRFSRYLSWFTEIARMILNHVMSSLVSGTRQGRNLQYREQRRTAQRIWHATLRELTETSVTGDDQKRLKTESLELWRRYGSLLDLKEGSRIMPAARPESALSDERCYWKIPRRCFSELCPCSAVTRARLHHRMRVCKGCWRVLYCNSQCQTKYVTR